MTPDQIKTAIEEALKNWQVFPWWAYLLLVILPACGSFFGAYLAEKAKNLATKEDIEEITEKVEAIRSLYAGQLEEQKGKNQLRLASVDKRLAAHQEAFALWRKLLSVVHIKDKVGPVVFECQEWWDHNCLYLTEEARAAFQLGYSSAFHHGEMVRTQARSELIDENWKNFVRAGDVLVKAVALPPLNETMKINKDPSS
jgi:hypothetical protein